MRNLLLIALLCGACGNSVINVKTDVAVKSEQKTATNMKNYATSTPPQGATSMGMMSQPRAGNTTIPITNVEVFQFSANVDDDGSMETLYWAIDNGTVFVWGQIDLVCVDDSDVATGETGTADFVYEADASGYGWMTATDSCGYATLFGCSADAGGAEVCGGCDWNDSFISCVAASS